MPIPRFNPSDPKIPSQVQPFKIAPPKDAFAREITALPSHDTTRVCAKTVFMLLQYSRLVVVW
jgi:hypothetical protein